MDIHTIENIEKENRKLWLRISRWWDILEIEGRRQTTELVEEGRRVLVDEVLYIWRGNENKEESFSYGEGGTM